MRLPAVLTLLVAACAATAHAEVPHDFQMVGVTSGLNKQVGFIDTASIVHAGNTLEYWTLWIWETPLNVGQTSISYALRMNKANCTERTSQQTFVHVYGINGDQLAEDNYSTSQQMEPVVPGTIGENSLELVCAKVNSISDAVVFHDIPSAVRVVRSQAAKIKELDRH